jgi:hypothetical protein
VEYPAGSGEQLTLEQVADRLTERVISLFKKDETGARPLHGKYNWFYQKPGNEDLFFSMNISMETPVMGWAPAIRPAGPHWWQS